MRIDQYGIRTRLLVAGTPLKFEIIREGRIPFERPGRTDVVMGLATATVTDLVAMKLLRTRIDGPIRPCSVATSSTWQ